MMQKLQQKAAGKAKKGCCCRAGDSRCAVSSGRDSEGASMFANAIFLCVCARACSACACGLVVAGRWGLRCYACRAVLLHLPLQAGSLACGEVCGKSGRGQTRRLRARGRSAQSVCMLEPGGRGKRVVPAQP